MKKLIILLVTTAIGAGAGYAYHLLFGCAKSCNISANWGLVTFYGGLIGFLAGLPGLGFRHHKRK